MSLSTPLPVPYTICSDGSDITVAGIYTFFCGTPSLRRLILSVSEEKARVSIRCISLVLLRSPVFVMTYGVAVEPFPETEIPVPAFTFVSEPGGGPTGINSTQRAPTDCV